MKTASTAERGWNTAARLVFGAGLMGAFFLIPLNLHAGIFDFGSITSLLGKIGSIEKDSAKSQSSIDSYDSKVIAPLGQLNATRDWLSRSAESYDSWSRDVGSVPISSASLGTSSPFEHDLLSGLGGSSSGAAIPSGFNSVYGTAPAPATVTTNAAQAVDVTDADSEAALTLATKSDSTATTLLASAEKLTTSAGSSTPGTAPMIAAQAAAMNLGAQAMQQHVLASLIRQLSARMAAKTAQIKTDAANHQAALQTVTAGSN